jgi:hypothetical protein
MTNESNNFNNRLSQSRPLLNQSISTRSLLSNKELKIDMLEFKQSKDDLNNQFNILTDFNLKSCDDQEKSMKHKNFHRKFSFNDTCSSKKRLTRQIARDYSLLASPTFEELEWDKHVDFMRINEPDRLSTYDLSERMAELLQQKFLEFEMMNASNQSISMTNYTNLNARSFYIQRQGTYEDEAIAEGYSKADYFLKKISKPIKSGDSDLLNQQDFISLMNTKWSKEALGLGYEAIKLNRRRFTISSSSLLSSEANAAAHFDYSLSVAPSNACTPVDCITTDDLIRIKCANMINELLAYSSPTRELLTPEEKSSLANCDTFIGWPDANPMVYSKLAFDVESYAIRSPESDVSPSDIKFSYPNEPLSHNSWLSSRQSKDCKNEERTSTEPLKFYYSLPDVRFFVSESMSLGKKKNTGGQPSKQIVLLSKHLSLLDMRSFDFVYDYSANRNRNLRDKLLKSLKLDLKPNNISQKLSTSPGDVYQLHSHYCLHQENFDPSSSSRSDQTPVIELLASRTRNIGKVSMCGSSFSFSRMSRMHVWRSYISKIGERFKQLVTSLLNSIEEHSPHIISKNVDLHRKKSLFKAGNDDLLDFEFKASSNTLQLIDEEKIVDSYDIIEVEDVMHTPTSLTYSFLFSHKEDQNIDKILATDSKCFTKESHQ